MHPMDTGTHCDCSINIKRMQHLISVTDQIETTHQTVAPKFAYKIKMVFDEETSLRFSRKSNHLDTTI